MGLRRDLERLDAMNEPRPPEQPLNPFAPPLAAAMPHDEAAEHTYGPPPRRWGLAIALFLATCASLFFVGWVEFETIGAAAGYVLAVMAILVTHELGHFVQSLRYGVPASLPYFIPFPSVIGTMGAVIIQYDRQEDRKELFDIGLTGPWAGLVVAIPLAIWGVLVAQPVTIQQIAQSQDPIFHPPLLLQWLFEWLRPQVTRGHFYDMNPQLQAGWFGLLLTGLNMMPIGQLDGGHVSYAIFRRHAGTVARIVVVAAMAWMVTSNQLGWLPMTILVLLIGLDHPPTVDDAAPLGWPRVLIGLVSFIIPVLCFTPVPISMR